MPLCRAEASAVRASMLPPLGTVGSVISTMPPWPEVMWKLPAE
jgi:hypothetical protein